MYRCVLQAELRSEVHKKNMHWWDVRISSKYRFKLIMSLILFTLLFVLGIFFLVTGKEGLLGLAVSGGAVVAFVLFILMWMHAKWAAANLAMESHVKALHLLYSEDLGPHGESQSQKVVYRLHGRESVHMLLENGTVTTRKPNWVGL